MSFGEKRDDGKTKVPTRSTRNASRLGRKKKGTTTTTTRFCPVQRRFIPSRKGRVPNATFPLSNGKKEVFTNDIRKRIKRVDDQSSKRRTSFFPISSALPFSLSLFSLARRKAQQPTRALPSYVLYGSCGCRAAQFISSRVTEKKRKRTTKNAFRNPSRRVARAPRNVQPRALSRCQKASRVPTSTAARVSRVAKKVVVRVSSFLSSKSVSSFLMTAHKGPPPSRSVKKCRLFFCFFVFFLDEKERFFFSFFFSWCGCFGLEKRSVCKTPLLRPRGLSRSSIEQPPFLFSNTTPSSNTPSRRTPARGGRGSRCFGVVHESSERARGERALTSPVEGGDL